MTATPDCPLNAREQTRNLLLYAANVTLIYVGAPALYVGLNQAALCKRLVDSKTLANLPLTLYFLFAPFPLIVAWYFSAVRQFKSVLVATYLIMAAVNFNIVISLMLPTAEGPGRSLWIIPAVLFQSAVLGWSMIVVANFQWEVIGRGVSPARRGQTLALAFGAGPVLAFLSSLGSQWLLSQVPYPWNFAGLFGASVPPMLLAAFVSTWFVVPLPEKEIERPPFVEGVFGGIGAYVRYRPTLLAGIATLLIACGYNIFPSFTLHTEAAVGELAEQYTGYQNALRFAAKVAAGLFLGWLLTRTNARAGMLVTCGFCLASVLWILVAPGYWFLVSFALMGAGELWGVYYPNYVLSSSAPSRMRRNMAITTLLYAPSAVAPVVYGRLGDTGAAPGPTHLIAQSIAAQALAPAGAPLGPLAQILSASRVATLDAFALGLRVSFYVAAAVLVATLLFVLVLLPARPSPPADEQALEPAKT